MNNNSVSEIDDEAEKTTFTSSKLESQKEAYLAGIYN